MIAKTELFADKVNENIFSKQRTKLDDLHIIVIMSALSWFKISKDLLD